MKKLFEKYREIIMYLIFGVTNTVLCWCVYYACLLGGRAIFSIPPDEVTGVKYMTLYSAAQIVQWVTGVLFAFFTNKKWVFTEADKKESTALQLAKFSGSRVVTFFLDYGITYGGTLLLAFAFPALVSVSLLGKERNLAEILSKIVAAVVVTVANYLISKLFVFRKDKQKQETNK